MLAIGMLWAAFAPISLGIMAVGLFSLLNFFNVPERWGYVTAAKYRFGVSAVIVAIGTLAIWLPDVNEFNRLCEAHGGPTVFRTVQTDGFFLNDSTANSFGMRHLHSDGFAWLEAKSVYHRNKFTRYEKVGDRIVEREIDQLTAKYEVRSDHVEGPGFSGSEITITEIATGEKLATASNLIFDGGRMKWFLGGWGVESCPSARSNPDAFRKMYGIAKATLNPGTQ